MEVGMISKNGKKKCMLLLFAIGTVICFACSKIYMEIFYFRFINFWLDFCNNEIFTPLLFFFMGATIMQTFLLLKDKKVTKRLYKVRCLFLFVVFGVYIFHIVDVINTRMTRNWLAFSPVLLAIVIFTGMVFALTFGRHRIGVENYEKN